ncbi:hypothetical protein [Streptococcus loxodontisalivarius]|uniref:Uncharacterized protein n=1 Tax=Streptococcus loxodontisalivarius TaxID=1349415 RepID=A0ABS2PQS1_9STRE|nr:hypothetical protein [Streptococcus loxodontisalivarius]MBM7642388.1 hypothetical protein [Streptococcus loxodontisalivarius]
MYRILTIDGDVVYLGQAEGGLKRVSLEQFTFVPKLGDQVDIFSDGETVLVVKASASADLDGDKLVKSSLLQGILDLFLETLSIHNNHLGNLKKIFSQLLITLFMAWSLFGVIVIEVLLFLESLIVFVYQLILKGFMAIRLGSRIKLWFDSREKKATLKRQKEEAQTKRDIRLMAEEVISESLSSSESQSLSESELVKSESESLS